MHVINISNENDPALGQFRQLPRAIYANDPIWAPASEAVFERLWAGRHARSNLLFQPIVALDAGRPVARAVAIREAGAKARDGSWEGYIGFFECHQGQTAAAAKVLAQCEELLRTHGARTVVVPKVDNQLFGCQTGGFDLPHLCLTPHNPRGYARHFRSAGYIVRDRLVTLVFARDTTVPSVVRCPGFTVRTFDRSRLEEEVRRFHELQHAIFGDRPGYVPRSLDEDLELVRGLLPYLVDDLVILAEDENGRVVGILVCLPDFYQHQATRLRIVSIGARPGYQKRGIGALMVSRLMQNLSTRPEITSAEASVILSRNLAPQNLARRFNGQPGRAFVVFSKSLSLS